MFVVQIPSPFVFFNIINKLCFSGSVVVELYLCDGIHFFYYINRYCFPCTRWCATDISSTIWIPICCELIFLAFPIVFWVPIAMAITPYISFCTKWIWICVSREVYTLINSICSTCKVVHFTVFKLNIMQIKIKNICSWIHNSKAWSSCISGGFYYVCAFCSATHSCITSQ